MSATTDADAIELRLKYLLRHVLGHAHDQTAAVKVLRDTYTLMASLRVNASLPAQATVTLTESGDIPDSVVRG